MQPISDESYITLTEILERFLQLSVKSRLALKLVLSETSYKKGAHILNAGSTQHTLWFLLKGLAREIRVNPDTFAENTAWFWFPTPSYSPLPGFSARSLPKAQLSF